ncbi:tetratricopeptide repeat protein [Endozoicomonas sp. Mp262]|uniref:YfgM family protein n=1 Tax=Endozoicomonas sp. Mp262 TaxID=2919499 RepID=UPI0021D9B577
MSYDSDEEQVEQLKRLWKEYGQPVIVGVLITLVGVFGYKAWQKNQYENAVAASQLYQNLLDTVGQVAGGDLSEEQESTMTHVVDTLQKDYSGSRYAAMATLFLVQQQVRDNELDKAEKSLNWILEQKPDPEVNALTRIRLARVLLAQPDSKAQKALDILGSLKPGDKSFVASVESARGDAYLALGQQKKAQEAYQKALDSSQAEGRPRPLLQLKLDDLALPQEG